MESPPEDLASMTAVQVRSTLGLEFLEGEGVWFRLLWRTEAANAIYALITREDFSALHRLAEDEMWVHVCGAPLRQHLLHPDGTSDEIVLGTNIAQGEVPQSHVPAGTWQAARPDGDWTLVVCALAPPFSGFELADRHTDLTPWPSARASIAPLIRDATTRNLA